ncbi:MAG: hypothetical protein Q4P78_05860 [Rothia sp. (in: high G+C Gram-positive bacteria)]|nr:hypothetical protein [Rothia sp. (in: high G+C Gram-positive bacteria)]MDO5750714.1 hypothetical protein [Rothia sp. (in: high G+C Gram-positive bacteria)]
MPWHGALEDDGPLVVQTVTYAHATGDALTARGLDRLNQLDP